MNRLGGLSVNVSYIGTGSDSGSSRRSGSDNNSGSGGDSDSDIKFDRIFVERESERGQMGVEA